MHFVLDQLLAHADFGFVLANPLVLGVDIFTGVIDLAAPGLHVFPRVVDGWLLQASLVLALEQRDLCEQGEEGLPDGHDGERVECER